jgi:hypothetical protein
MGNFTEERSTEAVVTRLIVPFFHEMLQSHFQMAGIGNSDEASEAQPWGRKEDSRATFWAQLPNYPYTRPCDRFAASLPGLGSTGPSGCNSRLSAPIYLTSHNHDGALPTRHHVDPSVDSHLTPYRAPRRDWPSRCPCPCPRPRPWPPAPPPPLPLLWPPPPPPP